MKLTAWTTLASLIVYIWISINVGRARMQHKVQAPLMEGPLEFLSVYRVQANTVEQLAMFLPALWMCAYFLGDMWAAGGGVIWIIGRIVYALGYYKDPAKRSMGFMLTFCASVFLIIGTAVGLIIH